MPFNVLIEDFVYWDKNILTPANEKQLGDKGPTRRDEWLQAALVMHARVSGQLSLNICDMTFATYRYGGDCAAWDPNWRQYLRQTLARLEVPFTETKKCGDKLKCAWDGHRHRHLLITLPAKLYSLVGYLVVASEHPYRLDNVTKVARRRELSKINKTLTALQQGVDELVTPESTAEQQELIRRYLRAQTYAKVDLGKSITPVYIPALLLGAAAGLSRRQAYLLTSLARELTRVQHGGKHPRADRVEVFGARDANHKRPAATECPFLAEGKHYVAFDGQNNYLRTLRGAGYVLGVRLKRAGYLDAEAVQERRRFFVASAPVLRREPRSDGRLNGRPFGQNTAIHPRF